MLPMEAGRFLYSSKPITTSTSGISAARSSAYRCAKHPVTITFFCLPLVALSAFIAAAARMAFTLSFLASSTKPQVLMMIASLSSWSSVMSNPSANRSPNITSPSTVFFGQPRETIETLARLGAVAVAPSVASPPAGGGAMEARGAGPRREMDLFAAAENFCDWMRFPAAEARSEMWLPTDADMQHDIGSKTVDPHLAQRESRTR
mmetsp:Transcript_19993/g.49647  ORF Transcript_19993/g.49647 Transcript_19993/m.49647 type:complete len:205 (-) Transcript_19993:21-635(-)